jgi:hypothetical protein
MTVKSGRVLLVEGKQDLRVIPELIEANGVPWGTSKDPVVLIRDYDGYPNLVNPDVLQAELQASGLSALGVIIDADENASDRWSSLRSAALHLIPDLPRDIPEIGLIHSTDKGIRFGAWIMPDNKTKGMLETFLTYLIRDEFINIWNLAQSSAATARASGAPFSVSHKIKAEIYTWLAWQDPPGRQLHQAVKERILNPTHHSGAVFIQWFRDLYQI